MKSITTIITILFILSCTSVQYYSEDQIIGDWDCYLLERNNQKTAVSKGEINFSFEKDSYKYKGYSFREEGSWRIEGKLLVTQAEGVLEKEVEIQKLSNDTLILFMHDTGEPMVMELIKRGHGL